MINLKKFYLIAGVLMLIAFLANGWTLFHNWHIMFWGARISFIFGTLLFQLLLITFFIGMYKMTPSMDMNSVDLSKMLDDFETDKKEVKKNGSI